MAWYRFRSQPPPTEPSLGRIEVFVEAQSFEAARSRLEPSLGHGSFTVYFDDQDEDKPRSYRTEEEATARVRGEQTHEEYIAQPGVRVIR